MMTHRQITAAMARAMRPYLAPRMGHSPTRVALTLAKHAVGVLTLEPEIDAYSLLVCLMRARLRNQQIICGDLQSCARVGADAWLRHGAALRAGRLAA